MKYYDVAGHELEKIKDKETRELIRKIGLRIAGHPRYPRNR